MIKAKVFDEATGRNTLIIGLAFGNLSKLMANPLDSFIMIDGKEMGLSVDVIIFSGENEQQMAATFGPLINKETQIIIDPKLAT